MINFKLKIIVFSVLIFIMTCIVGTSYLARDLDDSMKLFDFSFSSNYAQKNVLRDSYISKNYNKVFGINSKVTNSEIACMIFEIENLEYGYDYVFEDTRDNSYVGIISAVVKEKYMSANDEGMFLPDNYLTRSDFMKITYNIIRNNKFLGIKKERKYNDNLKDISNSENKNYIIKMYEYGIIDGNKKVNFRPLDFLTKEEAIVILNRIYGYNKGDFEHVYNLYIDDPYVDIDENYWAFKDIVFATIGLED